MESIKRRAKNLIYNIIVKNSNIKNDKNSFHLDFESETYRQSELIKLIRDTVIYFALTKDELSKINSESFSQFQTRAWKRISDRPKEKKGDYGELLLFLILEVFYPARKLITKVRLRSSFGDEIKGYDCAHFSIDEKADICLWLGEAKFHQDFSSAIFKAVESLNEHITDKAIKDELSILEGNNCEIEEETRAKIEEYLNSGLSLDKMKFKIPILLTYDCEIVKNHSNICDAFIQEIKEDLEKKYSIIDKKKISLKPNIELHFIIFPLESVKEIKEELENIEKAFK